MTITAKVILDSINPNNVRLSTLQLRFPRYILSQFNTHRVFSRSARSSRAVPVKKIIQDIIDDPVIPLHWGKNQPGMQAFEECNELVYIPNTNSSLSRESAWLHARDNAIEIANSFDKSGYHKQIVNRLLEPWLHVDVVLTTTKLDNFYNLRLDEDAQPEIEMLAKVIKEELSNSEPYEINYGEWHIPYITDQEWTDNNLDVEQLLQMSAARCARVSYNLFDGTNPNIEADLKLFNKLVTAKKLHASPLEHQGTPIPDNMSILSGNFHGYNQYRKCYEFEKGIISNR